MTKTKQQLLIIEGATGTGKTYNAIHRAKTEGNYAYLAPCRQLVIESYTAYATESDRLSTGDVKIGKASKTGSVFGVYETRINFSNFSSIIIDEAHFINDYDRGPHLLHIIEGAKAAGCNVFLLTATRTFAKLDGFSIEVLKPLKKFKIKKVSKKTAEKRMKAGARTIIFVKYADDADLHAGTLPSKRIKLQNAFQRGEINVIRATNVLAQGLNFPAENVIIEYNGHDSASLLLQKIGRLGRIGHNKDGEELTYALAGRNRSKTGLKKFLAKKAVKEEAKERVFSRDFCTTTFTEGGICGLYNKNKYAINSAIENDKLAINFDFFSEKKSNIKNKEAAFFLLQEVVKTATNQELYYYTNSRIIEFAEKKNKELKTNLGEKDAYIVGITAQTVAQAGHFLTALEEERQKIKTEIATQRDWLRARRHA